MGTPKILVVDDDKYICSSLKRLFQCHQWDVVTASCGKEALDILDSGSRFNVIVADYYMPNVNGIEFLKKVNFACPETYCIMLTAYPYCDAIKYAMDKYLKADLIQKPWDGRLIEKIENAIVLQQQQIGKQSS